MTHFTVDQLLEALRESAGEDEPSQLSAAILDVPFEDLGYDSLAVLNTVRKIERDHAVALTDDILDTAPTPRALLDEVNFQLAQLDPKRPTPCAD
jgi:minimal PKS acyl carrier protein